MNKPQQEGETSLQQNLFRTPKKLKKTLKSGKIFHAHGLTKLVS